MPYYIKVARCGSADMFENQLSMSGSKFKEEYEIRHGDAEVWVAWAYHFRDVNSNIKGVGDSNWVRTLLHNVCARTQDLSQNPNPDVKRGRKSDGSLPTFTTSSSCLHDPHLPWMFVSWWRLVWVVVMQKTFCSTLGGPNLWSAHSYQMKCLRSWACQSRRTKLLWPMLASPRVSTCFQIWRRHSSCFLMIQSNILCSGNQHHNGLDTGSTGRKWNGCSKHWILHALRQPDLFYSSGGGPVKKKCLARPCWFCGQKAPWFAQSLVAVLLWFWFPAGEQQD